MIVMFALLASGLVCELGLWWRRRRRRKPGPVAVPIQSRMYAALAPDGRNRIVLFCGRETYAFYWRDADLGPLLCQFGAWAANPELAICWQDASRLADAARAFQRRKKAVSNER